MDRKDEEVQQGDAVTPASELWQIPGIAVAVVIFILAAYIARSPKEKPSSQEDDFEALVMAYEGGNALVAVDSAERYLVRYPLAENEAVARFVFAQGKWDLIRSDPGAVIRDLTDCLASFRKALLGDLPVEYQSQAFQAAGDILLRLDQPNDALAMYTQLIHRFPAKRSALLSAAQAHANTRPASIGRAGELIERYLAADDLTAGEVRLGYLARARLAITTEDFDLAVASAERVLEAGPDGEVVAEGSLILARALMAKGNPEEAFVAADEALSPDAGRFEAPLSLARAMALWKLGKTDEAIRAFDDTIFRFPGTGQALGARYNLALLFNQAQRTAAAKDALVSLLDDLAGQGVVRSPYFEIDDVAKLWFEVGRRILAEDGSKAVHDYHLAALVLMTEGRLMYFDAVLYLREAEELERTLSGIPVLKRAQARSQIEKTYGEAARMFSKVLETATRGIHLEALFQAGHCYYKAGRPSLALRYLDDFAKAAPRGKNASQAMYEAASARWQIGDFDGAVESCRQNFTRHPANIYAYRALLLQGDLYRSSGLDRIGEAAEVYTTILTDERFDTTSSEWRRAAFGLGETLFKLGRWQEAILTLEEAVYRFPDDPDVSTARFHLARSYRQEGLAGAGSKDAFLDEAATLFEFIASPESGSSRKMTREAAFLLADCAYDSTDYDLAVKLYSRAAEAHIDTAEATRALFQIGNCYWHLGLSEQAKTTYRRAIFDLDRLELPLEPGGRYYRSIALWRLGGEA